MTRPKRHRDNVPAARALRAAMTPSERRLWELLRFDAYHGLRFRRQHPIGPFVVDFFWDALSLIIEVDGGVHEPSEQRRYDRQREAILSERGLRIVRLQASDVERDPGGVLDRALRPYLEPPPPWV